MLFGQTNRRAFIAALSGVTAWPLAVRAQRTERVRRIGVLQNLSADDPEGRARLAAFVQRLQELGWTDGHNVQCRGHVASDGASSTRSLAEPQP